jgi:hypothetical protein
MCNTAAANHSPFMYKAGIDNDATAVAASFHIDSMNPIS